MLTGTFLAVFASAHQPTCDSCKDGQEPTFCGVLAPPLLAKEHSITLTLCRGAGPAAALREACDASDAACDRSAMAAYAHELLHQTIARRGRASLASVPRWLPAKDRRLGQLAVAGNVVATMHLTTPHASAARVLRPQTN